MKSVKSKSRKLFLVCLALMLLVSSALSFVMPAASAADVPQDATDTPEYAQRITTNTGKYGSQFRNWDIVWSDEFADPALDKTKWDFQPGNGGQYGIGGWGNGESQCYTEGNNISFRDNQLIMTARQEQVTFYGGTYGYSSAKLRTMTDGRAQGNWRQPSPLYTPKYGRIEARIKLPLGTGLWPAFWMMPAYDVYGGWSLSGEIDIMEAKGRIPDRIGGALHFGYSGYSTYRSADYNPAGFNINDFHVYAVEWLEEGEMIWYVDGVAYHRVASRNNGGDWFTQGAGGHAPFDQEFYIILNLAVGGQFDGYQLDVNTWRQPAEMIVDYVRVYALDSGGDPGFAAVSDISGVPSTATAGVLTILGITTPSYATNNTITWSIKNAGTTGATLSGNKLNLPAAGTLIITGAVVNGIAPGVDFVKDFTITVSPAPVPGSLLSRGKPAYASSQEGGFAPGYVTDGLTTTRWSSAHGNNDEWIYIDLGQVYSVDKVVINWEAARASSFQIQVSEDGVNWVTVGTYTGTAGAQTVTFDPVNAQFVRMQGLTRQTAYGYSMYTMDVYGGPANIVIPSGAAVTGEIRSYNPNNPAAIQLMQGTEEKYSTTIEAEPGFGQVTQSFTFTDVEPGDYTLVVTKDAHTSFTVQTVTVGNADLDLTQDSRDAVKVMTLLCGDINGDQMINDNDLIVLWQAANYNKNVGQAANPLCDLNGDGVINDNDLIILWLAVNYNKGPVVVP